jgi:hypothetical protein
MQVEPLLSHPRSIPITVKYFTANSIVLDNISHKNGASKKKYIWDTILLKYSLRGEPKFGVINLNFSYDFGKDELDYIHIDYSDKDIKSLLETNPSILSKIELFRSRESC